jgi:hypothetical protein
LRSARGGEAICVHSKQLAETPSKDICIPFVAQKYSGIVVR